MASIRSCNAPLFSEILADSCKNAMYFRKGEVGLSCWIRNFALIPTIRGPGNKGNEVRKLYKATFKTNLIYCSHNFPECSGTYIFYTETTCKTDIAHESLYTTNMARDLSANLPLQRNRTDKYLMINLERMHFFRSIKIKSTMYD